MSSRRAAQPSPAEIERAIRERATRQLTVCTRLLAAALLALVARLVIAGPTPVSALTAAIIAVLFVASLLLAHHVRRDHPPAAPHRRQ